MEPEQAAKHALLEQDIVSIELKENHFNGSNKKNLRRSTKVLVN